MPTPLPIDPLRADIVAALRDQSRLVLRLPPGTGKSTRLPQFLVDDLPELTGKVVVLEPRRLATRMLARRVAEERGVALGGEVGYRIRLDQKATSRTRIEYLTEGILLRRLTEGDALPEISVVVFDEFHERSLYTDLSLSETFRLQQKSRPDLKLVVMSATLETGRLAQYLDPCHLLEADPPHYPVEIEYLPHRPPAQRPVWELAVAAIDKLPPEGDVLIFMPGKFEIDRTMERLRATHREWKVFPLHGELSADEQDRVLQPRPLRRIVVATNVAETSITVEGVQHVIDSGLARIPRFDPRRGMDALRVETISAAAADQRAGRAGRTGPGRCIRLWTRDQQANRSAHDTPEIHRVDLGESVLHLKQAGITATDDYPWFEPPDSLRLNAAETLLADLGAIEKPGGAITSMGCQMARFPLAPRYSRLLIGAAAHGKTFDAAWIAAAVQTRPILKRRIDREIERRRDRELGEAPLSDFFLLRRAHRFAVKNRFDAKACLPLGIDAGAARQVEEHHRQLLKLAECAGLPVGSEGEEDETLRRVILEGFPDRVARRLDGGTLHCELPHGLRGALDRQSGVRKASFLVAAEITEMGGQDHDIRLSMATAIDPDWLLEIFPESVEEISETVLDVAAKQVIQRQSRRFHGMILHEKRGGDPDPEAAGLLLASEVRAGRLKLKQWNDAVEQWIARLNVAAEHCPEQGWTKIGDEDRLLLWQEICRGATSFREARDRPVRPVLNTWLSAADRHLLENWFPERLTLPSGRKAKLRYEEGRPPVLSARIQELYDLHSTPTIADGRVPVLMEILAPNHRPVQVTGDLAGFWATTYPILKTELSRRYPKHEWR